MSEIWTSIIDNLKEWFIFYIAGLSILVWALVNRRRKKLLEKHNKQPGKLDPKPIVEKPRHIAQPIRQQPIHNIPEPKTGDDGFIELFVDGGIKKETTGDDVSGKIKRVTNIMSKNDHELDNDMVKDLGELKISREKILKTKSEIKKYGLELGKLFDKYSAREHQLNAMIIGMESLVKEIEGKQQRLNPQQPPQ